MRMANWVMLAALGAATTPGGGFIGTSPSANAAAFVGLMSMVEAEEPVAVRTLLFDGKRTCGGERNR